MKEKQQVFAIVRVEHQDRLSHIPRDEVPTWVRVSKVLPTAREAVAEADRLNALNGHHGCYYYPVPTRWFPQGLGGEAADAGPPSDAVDAADGAGS
ncbi:MAG TPA: hypothetical protein VF006_30610 [Longimicrobium sp.]